MTPEFRVWHPDTQEFEYLKLQSYNYGSFTGLIDNFGDDQAIWEPYTGLKDVNGNQIFEGDMLKSSQGHTRPFYYLVKYSEQYAAFVVDNLFLGGVSGVDLEPYEVAGNIHENIELLEVDE